MSHRFWNWITRRIQIIEEEGCIRPWIQPLQLLLPPLPDIPSVPLYRLRPFLFLTILLFTFFFFFFRIVVEKERKETYVLAIGVCVCRLGVRNVQCVGVHEIPLKAGWTRWPCNLIKQKTRSRWGFYFFFLLFKHDMWLEGTERAFLVFFFMCCIGSTSTRSAFQVYHQRVVRPDQRRIFIPPGSISQVSLSSCRHFFFIGN